MWPMGLLFIVSLFLLCVDFTVLQEWTEELLMFATNLLAVNGSVLSYLEKVHTRLTHVLDVNGRIPVKK